MAITSEFVGSLNTPGYVFKNSSPVTYALPKFPSGASIKTIRWSGNGNIAYDILNKETGAVLKAVNTASYGHVIDSSSDGFPEVTTKETLLRFKNNTEVYMSIVPNIRKSPPVWNG